MMDKIKQIMAIFIWFPLLTSCGPVQVDAEQEKDLLSVHNRSEESAAYKFFYEAQKFEMDTLGAFGKPSRDEIIEACYSKVETIEGLESWGFTAGPLLQKELDRINCD